MRIEHFITELEGLGLSALIGVPDSTLKEFCDYVGQGDTVSLPHYVPANEGAAVGLAIGKYLATGKPACVYMQNSGLGNAVNPITSLASKEVYDIPMLFMIGWRGEPGVKDEPQHKFMGQITLETLEVLKIAYSILEESMTAQELAEVFCHARRAMEENRSYAFVIKKGTFTSERKGNYTNSYTLKREDAIAQILRQVKPEDIVVSTTGKISREVYEQSDMIHGNHKQCFLTVGGMGHTSMIALGIAQEQREKRVFCIEGDGAIFMHMGSLALVAKENPKNLVHICLNNEAHESVGGMSTGAAGVEFSKVAKAVGYDYTAVIETKEQLEEELEKAAKGEQTVFLEIKVSMESRADLGRPQESAVENKINFMNTIG